MSETKFDKIRIVSDQHGKRTFVYLNGEELKFLSSVKFEVSVGEYNKVTLTLTGNIEIEADVLSDNIETKTI